MTKINKVIQELPRKESCKTCKYFLTTKDNFPYGYCRKLILESGEKMLTEESQSCHLWSKQNE